MTIPASASSALLGSSGFSAWQFITEPSLGQIIASIRPAMPSSFLRRDVLPPVAQGLRRPAELGQDLVDAGPIFPVERLAFPESLVRVRSLTVREDRHEPEFTHDGHEILDRSRAAPG